MKRGLLLLFFPAFVGAGSLRKVPGKSLNDVDRVSINMNFQKIDAELSNVVNKTKTETITGQKTFSSKLILPSKSKANLLADAPGAVGEIFYCSDCTTDAVCISTGTGAGAVARLTARTTACD